MKIVAFGDSFTAGEGTDWDFVDKLKQKADYNEQKYFHVIEEHNKNHSWVRYLGDELGLEWRNFGEVGSTNFRIFNHFFEKMASSYYNRKSTHFIKQYSVNKNVGLIDHFTSIEKDDLVIIMWSSSVRDHLPYFPNIFSTTGPIGTGWSLKELYGLDAETSFRWRKYSDENKQVIDYIKYDLKEFMEHYFKFYLTELYTEEYYSMLNQNYILLLQKYLEDRNIKYIMCDAFESMVGFENKNYDKSHFINKKCYWGFGKETIWSFLDKTGEDVFEDPKYDHHPEGQKLHPNINGHKLIAKELKEFWSL